MNQLPIEKSPVPSPPRRVSKLLRVLVVGGAMLAAASSSFLHHGDVGTPMGDQDDGGTKGW